MSQTIKLINDPPPIIPPSSTPPSSFSTPSPNLVTSPTPSTGQSQLVMDIGADKDFTLVKYGKKKSESRTGDGPSSDKYISLPFDANSPPSKKPRTKKRQITARQNEYDLWNKYFIVAKVNGDFQDETPIQVCKMVHSAIGKALNVKKTGAGKIHIEVKDTDQSQTLSQLQQLGETPVEVIPNKRLNTSQGVVACRALLMCSEEELLEELQDQGVLEVRRIKRKVGNTFQPTPSLVLTFERPQPPQNVVAAYYKLDVRAYIPSPMRCFKCLRFGHTSTRCKAVEAICGCGMVLHPNKDCQDPPICVNCAAAHNARSPVCPVFIEEKEIQKVKTEKKMAYFEAKAIVKSPSYIKSNKSFSQAAATKINRKAGREIATQTEITPIAKFFQSVSGSPDGVQAPQKAVAANQLLSVAPAAKSERPTNTPERDSQGPLALPSASRVISPDLPPPETATRPGRGRARELAPDSGGRRCSCNQSSSVGGETSCTGYDSEDSHKTFLSQDSFDLQYGVGIRKREKKPGRQKGRPKKTPTNSN